MRRAALLLLLVLGCAEDNHHSPRPDIVIPPWLSAHPDLEAELRVEIAYAGIPDGWQVVIREPQFSDPRHRDGAVLLRGLCDYSMKRIDVGFRIKCCEDRPLLPGLLHERDHAVTGDPCQGHDSDCQ